MTRSRRHRAAPGAESREANAEIDLETEGHDLIARGHARLAEAARLRAFRSVDTRVDWIRVDSLPIPKRSAFVAARSGELRAVKRGRVWLTRRADADDFLKKSSARDAANDAEAEDDVRAALGLVCRRRA